MVQRQLYGLRAAQRIAHQPPRARYKRWHQKPSDLARDAVGLHTRVRLRHLAGNRSGVARMASQRDQTVARERLSSNAFLVSGRPDAFWPPYPLNYYSSCDGVVKQ